MSTITSSKRRLQKCTTHTHTHTHTHAHIHTQIHSYIRIHTCIHTYIHTYTCTHTRTHPKQTYSPNPHTFFSGCRLQRVRRCGYVGTQIIAIRLAPCDEALRKRAIAPFDHSGQELPTLRPYRFSHLNVAATQRIVHLIKYHAHHTRGRRGCGSAATHFGGRDGGVRRRHGLV